MSIASIHKYTVDLDADTVRDSLRKPMGMYNAQAQTFALEITQGGKKATITGAGCSGYFVRADGTTVLLSGTVSGNIALVTLSAACYAVAGRCKLSVNLTQGSDIHTLLMVEGYVDTVRTDKVADPESVIPDIDDLLAQISAMDSATTAANKAAERCEAVVATAGTGQMVYCWGDSLTQGIGGNVNGWHLISYPQILAERCNAVNLGILSDNLPTIQARQGSLKILLPACTIPGDCTQYVEIGAVDDGLPLNDGTRAYLLKYGDAGVNPCYVNDVPCVLFRDYKATTTEGTTFRLRRLESGDPVAVLKNTQLVTYGAKHYKGGMHIFWMGANGGYGNATSTGTDLAFSDYVARLQACIDYSEAADYLVIYARERVGYAADEAAEKATLAKTFAGHFVDLVPQLCDRGLLYGETSLWDGTKVNGVPSVLDSGDGCHFSFYGYRAIANIIWEYLYPKLQEMEYTLPTPEATGDDFGEWLYKLKHPKAFTASTAPINTGFKPFAEGTGDFTFAIRFSRDAQPNNGVIRPFWLQKWFSVTGESKALAFGMYNDATGFTMPKMYMMLASGAFLLDPDGMSLTLPEGDYHTIIIARSGTQYSSYIDGQLIYGSALDYTDYGLTCNDAVYIGGDASNNFIGTIADVRVYNTFFATDKCKNLYNDMNT